MILKKSHSFTICKMGMVCGMFLHHRHIVNISWCLQSRKVLSVRRFCVCITVGWGVIFFLTAIVILLHRTAWTHLYWYSQLFPFPYRISQCKAPLYWNNCVHPRDIIHFNYTGILVQWMKGAKEVQYTIIIIYFHLKLTV